MEVFKASKMLSTKRSNAELNIFSVNKRKEQKKTTVNGVHLENGRSDRS